MSNAFLCCNAAQLEGKNLQIKDLGDQKTELEQKHEADNRAVAVIIRTLEAELEKAQSANPSDPALSSSHPTLRLQRSISALSSKPSVESLTMAKCTATETELLIQQLTDQNQTLQDQIEALRANPPPALSESTTGDGQAFNSLPTGNTVDYDETLRRPQSGSSPTFPKRSSSVRELLNMKPDADGNLQRSPHTSPSLLRRSRTIGGGSNTLQAELSSINRYQAEIDNLRAENLALVNYLVATLDSLNKATMAR
ncbi:hypothetical protein DFJ77DRAFT_142838 [Powellomyces hirtus]|nr:hypothetical protein DFJ77DRAFT_142838 [Powellomyces hirtus]